MIRTTLLGTLLSLLALTSYSQADSLQLVELYNSTEGDGWFTSWDLNAPMSTWNGITVTDSGTVTAISLNNNNLKGALPNLNLPELLELVLANNTLRDTMPPLSTLRKLQFLDLTNNQLDGQLPDFNLPMLTTLRLANNRLEGGLHDFQNMPGLRTLIISGNRLTGGLPDFSNLGNLFNLILSENNLDGPLVDFTNLPNLITLDLHDNEFILGVPQYGRSTDLFVLDVSENQLTDGIPSFSRLALLETLRLNDNKFTGKFPNFGALQNLAELDVSNNFLEGQIPTLSSNVDLVDFSASANALTGSIPSFLNLEQLQRLDLSENLLRDTIPDFSHLPNLTELRLDSNFLNHSDFDVTTAPNLEVVEIEWNQMTFRDLFDLNGLGLLVFDYAPQRPIVLPDTICATIGDNVTIDLIEDQGVGSNTYSWYLDDVFRTATAVNELLLTNINALDTGIHHCIVKNNNFPALSLFSEDLLLIMKCPINEIIIADTICQGDTLFVNGAAYFEAGQYRDTVLVPEPTVCDSVFIITLGINEVYDTMLLDTICESDKVEFGGVIITESGTYTDTLSSTDGCDSIVTLQLVVWPGFRMVQAVTICAGETFFVGDRPRTESGIYDDTLLTVMGCDSLIITDLEVLDAFISVVDTTLCFRDTMEYRDMQYTESGQYVEAFTSSNGCDSSYILNLTIPTTDSFFIRKIICSSDTAFVGDTFYTVEGNYMDSLINEQGCDSLVFLTLQVVEMFERELDMSLCEGDTLFFGGDTITEAGIYIDSLSALGGCDSIIKLRLNTVEFIAGSIDTVLCVGDSLVVGTSTYKEPGFYRDTTSSGGCDTVIVTRLRYADLITLEGVAVQNAIENDGMITPTLAGGAGLLSYRWSTGDTTISIGGLDAGSYDLTVSDTLMCSANFSFEIEQSVSSEDITKLSVDLDIFPNPTGPSHELHLKTTTDQFATYTLYVRNMLGQIIAKETWPIFQLEQVRTIQAPQEAGFYFVQLSNEEGQTKSKRFTVQ